MQYLVLAGIIAAALFYRMSKTTKRFPVVSMNSSDESSEVLFKKALRAAALESQNVGCDEEASRLAQEARAKYGTPFGLRSQSR